MSPRPTTGHVRRPAILKAAAEVIAERGVIGTRIADVAERAGTSPPGVLYWFATKDELLTEALAFNDDRFYAELSGRLAELDSARDRLARLVELWPSEGDQETVLWMELWVRALRDPAVNAARAELDARWRAAIAGVVREGQATGEFGGEDPEGFALTLGALMDGFAIQLALRDPAVTPELVREHCMALVEERLGLEGVGDGV
jgi:AcrR family transcriptional regulator